MLTIDDILYITRSSNPCTALEKITMILAKRHWRVTGYNASRSVKMLGLSVATQEVTFDVDGVSVTLDLAEVYDNVSGDLRGLIGNLQSLNCAKITP